MFLSTLNCLIQRTFPVYVRFSQFFLSPLFTESATEREVKAVNSEHEKNIPRYEGNYGKSNRMSNMPDIDSIPATNGVIE